MRKKGVTKRRKAVVSFMTAVEKEKLSALTVILNSASNSNTLRLLAMNKYDDAVKFGVIENLIKE